MKGALLSLLVVKLYKSLLVLFKTSVKHYHYLQNLPLLRLTCDQINQRI